MIISAIFQLRLGITMINRVNNQQTIVIKIKEVEFFKLWHSIRCYTTLVLISVGGNNLENLYVS